MVLTAVQLKIQALRVVTPCRWVYGSRRFEGPHSLTQQMMALRSFETSGNNKRRSVIPHKTCTFILYRFHKRPTLHTPPIYL